MMYTKTGAELQAARKAATERFLAIAAAIKAEAGVIGHKHTKSLSGRAWPHGYINAPEGRTRKQLYILAHECGHIALNHGGRKLPKHIQEMEAEKWAHALRRHGISVPRSMTMRAKRYVARKIRQAKQRGAKRINAEAAHYATTYIYKSEKRVMTELEAAILEQLIGDYVSFGQLECIDGFKGKWTLFCAGHPNIVLWLNISAEAAAILQRFRKAGYFHCEQTDLTTYLIDSDHLPNLPIAKQVRQYKTPHWLPVVLRRGAADADVGVAIRLGKGDEQQANHLFLKIAAPHCSSSKPGRATHFWPKE